MIKDRLKEMDLRITEIADYLQLSRPTVYKFIDCYDARKFKAIDDRVLKLFNFIEENALAGKRGVISFILNNLTESAPPSDESGKVMNYLRENPASKKSRFLCECAESDIFDGVIYYLADVKLLLNKKDLSADEKAFIAPYAQLIENLNKIQRRK